MLMISSSANIRISQAGRIKERNNAAHSSYPGFARKTSRVDWVQYDELHTYWQSQNGGKDPAAAYRQYVKAGRIDPENPLTSALIGWVPGSESFLRKAIALAQSDDDQKRQRTSRRLKAVTADHRGNGILPRGLLDRVHWLPKSGSGT